MDLHKFAPCKYVANMKMVKSKYMAKIVNATFAYRKTVTQGGVNQGK